MTTSRRAALGLAVLLLAGCAGPGKPLNVAFKEFPSDIVLGVPPPPKPPVASVPPVPLQTVFSEITGFGSGFAPGTPQETPVLAGKLPPPKPACPRADPFAVPAIPAANAITALPSPATYTYRNSGSFKIGGPTTFEGLYPAEATRTVENEARRATRRDGAMWYEFDVTTRLADTVTTTTYQIHPESPPSPPTALKPGLYVGKEVTKGTNGAVRSSFQPNPPMLLLPFPATSGFAFDVVATDGESVINYRGRVGLTERIDVCGAVVDAIKVHIDGDSTPQQCPVVGTCVDPDPGAGKQIRPDGRTDFKAEYAFVPQYGGLAVYDKVIVDSTESGAAAHRENQATINREPGPTRPFF